MECRIEENKLECSCTYTSCRKRGLCCECVRSHRENGEIPGCFFTAAGEATYDRSIANFIKVMSKHV